MKLSVAEDLIYQNELLRAEIGRLHSFIHGQCLQMKDYGHLFTDGTGSIGVDTDFYYSSAALGATLEDDYRRNIVWAVPTENVHTLKLEVEI